MSTLSTDTSPDPPQVAHQQELIVEIVFEPEDHLVLAVDRLQCVVLDLEVTQDLGSVAVADGREIGGAHAEPLIAVNERCRPLV